MVTSFKTILIDDEEIARNRLRRLLQRHSEYFEIIGEAQNGNEALSQIEKLRPDLIFLDIEMPGLNGFELLKRLDFQPIVIFCTAYDHYALQAFETHSIDYLLKPVEPERLLLTIEKLEKTNHQHQNLQSFLQTIEQYLPKKEVTSIPFKVGDRVILVKLENILYFEAKNKYVNYFDVQGKSYLTEQSLVALEEKLPPYFTRISKSIIVNKNKVLEYQKYFKGKFVIILDDAHRTQLISGEKYTERIRRIFEF